MTQDKENLARAEEEMKELRERLSSLQEELQKANTKLSVYDKAGLLKLPEKDPALLQLSVAAPSRKEFEKLHEAHSELQLLYREKSRELEQLSVTLISHSATYQALQTQVTKVIQESEEKEKHLNITIRSLQDTIKRRDERCDKMEVQILTLTNQGMKEKLEELGSCLTQTVGLGKHDNVLEFHIDRVVFEPPEFSSLKTFVSWTVPFSLEDPLQHTNVARGSEAHYNYSALYKFQVNSRNLMSLREDTVTVSVYILLDSGHPAKVGECAFTFQEVLDHPRNTLHGTVPVVLAHDDAEEAQHLAFMAHIATGQVIGNMSYWFRLQRPSEDAIAQYLRTSGKLAAAQREKSVPRETKVTKSSTSSAMLRSMAEVDKKLEIEQIPKKEGGEDTHREALPVPAPRLQKHPSLSLNKKSSSSEKSEGNVTSGRPHQDALEHTEHTPSNSVCQSESDSQGHPSLITDPRVQQMTHSRSGSSSSTGTYNVEIPMKSKTPSNLNIVVAPRNLKSNLKNTKPRRVNSEGSSADSSTGTYNVESPKMAKITGNSNTDAPKILKSSKLKRTNSGSSSASSGRSSNHEALPLTSSRKSVQSKSSAHAKEEVGPERSKEEPTTSHINMATVPPPHHMDSLNPSRSQPVSSENSSDSSLEENKNLEKSHIHRHQESSAQRDKKSIMKIIAAETAEERMVRSKKSDKSTTETKAQHQLVMSRDTSSSNGTKQEESEDQRSSSESSHTSDSEGVVAVVSKTRKSKKSRVYIEVSSLTFWPNCGVLQDPMVELVFVDYHGFLDLPPDQLETPLSLPKNAPDNTLNFNFRQEFNVDKKQYPAHAQALKELMNSRGILKFTVTSEPSEEMQETHDCQDLGYAYVDLHQLAHERQDIVNEMLAVESTEDGSQIGVLRVTLHIVQALQYLGLA